MKVIYIISMLFLLTTVVRSQTLQFSRVIMIADVQQEVPVGKVWKVEAFWQAQITATDQTNGNSCGTNYRHSPFYVNSNYYYIFESVSTGYSAYVMGPGNNFPIWLPEGTTLRTVCSKDFLSVIEFNIIP